MKKAFSNILVIVKQTPYEFYLQLKSQGKAPVALRWERLKNRYMNHRACVDDVTKILNQSGINYDIIGREELHRGSIQDKDLVIAVGGDGTILNACSFLDDSVPILGVNSDPTNPSEKNVIATKDERRSRGALAGTNAHNVHVDLPRILFGDVKVGERARIRCLIRSSYTETRMPPALNDILVTSPSPADVSRFRLSKCQGKVIPSYSPTYTPEELFYLNVWSSGIWISSATGSTAAIHSAGGELMDYRSKDLQYMVREHLVEDGFEDSARFGNGMIKPDENMVLRWNSRHGMLYVDGSFFKHPLELGDQIKIDGNAPPVLIFDRQSVSGVVQN